MAKNIEFLSAMIQNRTEKGAGLLMSLDVHGEQHARKADERLIEAFSAGLGEGQEAPSLVPTVEVIRTSVGWMMTTLKEKDSEYISIRTRLARLRQKRDEQTESLSQLFQRTRDMCRGSYGKEILRPLTLEDRTTDRPISLVRQTEVAVQELRAHSGQMPAFIWTDGEPSITPEMMIAKLEPAGFELGQILSDIEETEKRFDQALVAKDQATAFFDRQFPGFVRMTETIYRLAGEDVLAERIAKKARQLNRPTPTAEPDDDGTDGEPRDPPAAENEPVTADEAGSSDETPPQSSA